MEFEYGTIEASVEWAFKKTEQSIPWIKRWVAKKHGITQKSADQVIRFIFSEEEIMERSKRNAKKHGAKFDSGRAYKRHVDSAMMDKKFKQIMEG